MQTAQRLAAVYETRAEPLQIIDAARRQWHHDTEPVRMRSDQAGTELSRRGLPRDPIPEAAEQISLFTPPATRSESSVALPASRAGGRQGAGERAWPGPSAVTGHAEQNPLFTLSPNPRHVAAASALGQSSDGRASEGGAAVTLAQAMRQLEITADLRSRHSGWTDALDRLERQLEHRAERQRGHDTPQDYLRRSHAHELDHEIDHDHDLDQGMEL